MWPTMPDFSGRVGEAHARLSAGADDSSVCTIPLLAHGRSSGALTLLRPRNQPMGTDEVVRAETLAALLGPAIETQRRADRGALSRMLDTTTRFAGKLFGPGLLRIKIATASAVALLAFLGFASGAYDVPAEALLEGRVHVDEPTLGVDHHERGVEKIQKGHTVHQARSSTISASSRRT